MQVEDVITLAHEDSLTAEATTGADWEITIVVETHDQEGDNVEREKGADVSEMGITSFLLRPPESTF